MSPLVTNVRGDISPKKSLAFTATESEYLRQFLAFRTDIPLNETLGAPGEKGGCLMIYGGGRRADVLTVVFLETWLG